MEEERKVQFAPSVYLLLLYLSFFLALSRYHLCGCPDQLYGLVMRTYSHSLAEKEKMSKIGDMIWYIFPEPYFV